MSPPQNLANRIYVKIFAVDNFSCGISRVSLYSQIKYYNITCVICIISAWRVHCTIPQINVAQQAFWGFYIPMKISTHTIHTLSLHTHDVSTHPTFFTNQTTWLTCDWQSSSETLAQCAADVLTTWSQQPEAIESMSGYDDPWSIQIAQCVSSLNYIKTTTAANSDPYFPLCLLLERVLVPLKDNLNQLACSTVPGTDGVQYVWSDEERHNIIYIRSILAHDACRISHVKL